MRRHFFFVALLLVILAAGATVFPQQRPTAIVDVRLETQLLAAESIYWRGEYDSARVAWSDILANSSIAAQPEYASRIHTWLTFAEWRLGNYEEARRHGESALQIEKNTSAIREMPRTFNGLGLVAWNAGELDRAIDSFREGLSVAEQENDVVTAGKLAGNLGLVEFDLARFDAARAGFEKMRKVGVESGDKRVEGNALTNLAMLEVQLGNAHVAVENLKRARALYRAVGYETGEENALGQLATAFAALGRLQSAFAVLDSANIIALKKHLKQEVASNLEILGNLYRDAGEYRKALKYYTQSQKLNDRLGLRLEQGTVLRKIAEIQDELGITSVAVSTAARAARIHEVAGARYEELKDRAFLAERRASYASADFQRLQALLREVKAPGARALVALTSARIAQRHKDHAGVLARLAADSSALRGAGFDIEAQSDEMRAEALAARGDIRAGIVAARRAVDGLERVRTSLGSRTLRASFAAQRAGSYARLIEYQLSARDPMSAYATAALARARDFGRIAETTDPAARQAAQALVRIRYLTEELVDQEQLEASGSNLRKRDRLNEELEQTRSDYESLIARSSWTGDEASGSGVKLLQSVLDAHEAVLEYYVSEHASYGFVVTSSTVVGKQLQESAASLFAKVRLGRAAVAERHGERALAVLYNSLVGPFKHELKDIRRLVVVPHAALSYAPFAAFHDETSHRYLIEDYSIQYLPASSHLVTVRHLPAAPRTSAAVFEPKPYELPASDAEAKSVRAEWGGRIYKGAQATRAAVSAALASSSIVHVTSHAELILASPMFSFLSMHDGPLEVHDIFAARVRAPLVFLSGCETALGGAAVTNYETGDDASTFTRAFLAAGAHAVVATLWRIEDQSAAQLTGSFYNFLKTNDGATSLAQAQRAMLKSAEYDHPFYWAAYTFNGDIKFAKGRT